MTIERRRVYFSGEVQGVGFRMTTRRLASGFPITGFVRNLSDGRVELLVEGEAPMLIHLIGSIQREFGSSIRETWGDKEVVGDPPLDGFSIH